MVNVSRSKIPGLDRQVVLFLTHVWLYQMGIFGITDLLLNFYFRSLGYETDTIGVLQSLARLSSFIFGVPIGLLADRIGARRVSIWAMYALGLSYAIMILSPTLSMLILSRLVMGVGVVAANIAAAPIIMGITSREDQLYVFSYFSVIGTLGSAAGTFLGGFIPGLAAQWLPQADGAITAQSPTAYAVGLAVSGVFCVVSVWPMFYLAEVGGKKKKRNTPRSDTPWLRLAWLSVPFVLFGITAGLTFPYYNLFFRDTFNLPDASVGTIQSIGWVIMGLSTLVGPRLSRHIGRAVTVVWGMMLATVSYAILGGAGLLAVAVVAYWLAISGRNIFVPLYPPLVMDNLPPEQHNAFSALNSVLWSLGFFASSSLGGVIVRDAGYDTLLHLVAVGCLLTGLLVFVMFRKRPHG